MDGSLTGANPLCVDLDTVVGAGAICASGVYQRCVPTADDSSCGRYAWGGDAANLVSPTVRVSLARAAQIEPTTEPLAVLSTAVVGAVAGGVWEAGAVLAVRAGRAASAVFRRRRVALPTLESVTADLRGIRPGCAETIVVLLALFVGGGSAASPLADGEVFAETINRVTSSLGRTACICGRAMLLNELCLVCSEDRGALTLRSFGAAAIDVFVHEHAVAVENASIHEPRDVDSRSATFRGAPVVVG